MARKANGGPSNISEMLIADTTARLGITGHCLLRSLASLGQSGISRTEDNRNGCPNPLRELSLRLPGLFPAPRVPIFPETRMRFQGKE